MLNLIHYKISNPRLIRNSVILIINIIYRSTNAHTHIYTHTLACSMYKSPRTKAMKVYINRKPKSCKCDNLTWFNASFYRVTLSRFIFIHFFHFHNHQIHNFLSSSLSLDLYHHHVNMPYTNNCLWCNFGYWCMNEYRIKGCLFIYFNCIFHLFRLLRKGS